MKAVSRMEATLGDYDLTGLSSRSFEQLIQSLAVGIIGPNIVIFGDGPDGAREATFEGRISYPTPESCWTGYGVIQAKFLQRPVSTAKDGAWILEQLDGELSKFVDRKRKLRKPEYYILATNVVLSPVAKKGFKDRVLRLLQHYSNSLNLKDFDVWDYDKIRIFLDNNRDVAVAYAAWITPGDVLSQILNWVQFEQTNLDDVLTNFLQKELLNDQYAKLEQAGHSTESPVPLASVFTDLPAYRERLYEPIEESMPLPPGFAAEMLEVAKSKFDTEALAGSGGSIKTEELGTRVGRFVLIGGPGQGKSTLGQYVCQLFRAALLHQRPRLTAETKRALDHVGFQCKLDNTELPTARRFPVRIVLSEFAKALSTPETSQVSGLLPYIVKRISDRTSYQLSTNAFRKWLSRYPWIIILDGLDEVPASSNRDQVLAAINDFWIDTASAGGDILVIATTRPQGYSYEFSPDFYTHRYLAPLSTSRALQYGQRFVSVRYGGDADRQGKIVARLRRAAREKATERLMRSPLQVTIMATLVDRLGQPPEERWSLFRDYYKVIYDREVERDIPAANILRQFRSDIDAIHYQTGLLLQVESERTGKTDAKLTSGQFGDLVRSYLKEEGHEGDDLDKLSNNVITTAAQRLVFLVGLESDQVGFEIRSLQEFMAAEGLMQGNETIVTERLRLIAPLANWRAVFLFAAGKCFADRKYLRDTIQAICAELNEDASGFGLSIVRAGSQLAIDLLEDGTARSQPKYAQTLARLGCRLMDLPPEEGHLRLASMYQKELHSVYKQEIETRISGMGGDRSQSAWTCAAQLDRLRVDWATALIRKAPPEAICTVLRKASAYNLTQAVASRTREVIPQCSPQQLAGFIERVARPNFLRSSQRTPWAYAVRQLTFYSAESRRRVPFFAAPETPILIAQLMPIKPNWLRGLRTLPHPQEDWEPALAAAKFLGAPSRSGLSEALRRLASLTPASVKTKQQLPWPIAACVQCCNKAEDFIRLADVVDSGALGDSEDWLAAEERWYRGVQLEELSAKTESGLPFDARIRAFGFPISAVSGWSGIYVSGTRPFIHKLQTLEPSLAAYYAGAFFFLTTKAHYAELSDDDLQYLIRTSATSDWSAELAALTKVKELTPQWEETLDYVGLNANGFYTVDSVSSDISRQIYRAFLRDPSRNGLLFVLAALSASSTLPEVTSEILESKVHDSVKVRNAVTIIRLAQSKASESDIEELAKLLLGEADSTKGNWIADLIIPILSRKTEPSLAIRILLRLIPALESSRYLYSQLLAALNRVLKKRKSDLAEPVTWTRLQLQPRAAYLLGSRAMDGPKNSA